MVGNIQVLQAGQRMARKSRRPNFPIAGIMKPYGLYPLMAHPVLPGETMQSATAKLRCISMPVKHPLAGAWLETWLVYVKFTDLDADLGQMFISDSVATTGYTATGDDPRTFVKSGQIDWVRLCLEKIHSSYFIHEDETARTIDGVPKVKLNNVSWYQNMVFEEADVTVPTSDASDQYEHLQGYMMLQQMQMTELTYEKYLEQYGAKPVNVTGTDPEILRFSRSWTQPVNTIDPSTGSPSSAWVWSDEIKADKAKRFQEPGFVVMLAAVRPKMYQGNITSSMLGNMWGFSDWFPAYTLDDPTSSVKKLAKSDDLFAAGATDAGTEVLLYDHSDLLAHGEQFINCASTDHIHPLPLSTGLSVQTGSTNSDLRGEYPNDADVASLFVSATAGDQFLYYEGMSSMVISGHVQDNTK